MPPPPEVSDINQAHVFELAESPTIDGGRGDPGRAHERPDLAAEGRRFFLSSIFMLLRDLAVARRRSMAVARSTRSIVLLAAAAEPIQKPGRYPQQNGRPGRAVFDFRGNLRRGDHHAGIR